MAVASPGGAANRVTVGPRASRAVHLEGVRSGLVSSQVSLFSQIIRSAGELRPQQQQRRPLVAKTFNNGSSNEGVGRVASSAISLASASHLGYTPVGKPARIHVVGDGSSARSQLAKKDPQKDRQNGSSSNAADGGGQFVTEQRTGNSALPDGQELGTDGPGFRTEEWTVYEELPHPPPPTAPSLLSAKTETKTATSSTTTTPTKTAAAGTAVEAARRQREYTEQRRRREASEATRRHPRASPEQLPVTREEWTVYETIPAEHLVLTAVADAEKDNDNDSVVGYRRYLATDGEEKTATAHPEEVQRTSRFTKRSEQQARAAASAAPALTVTVAEEAAAREFAERRARDGLAARRATTPVRLQKWTEVSSRPVDESVAATAGMNHRLQDPVTRHQGGVSVQERRRVALAQSPIGYKRYLETAASAGDITDVSGRRSPDYCFYSDENARDAGHWTRGSRRAPKSRVYKRVNLRSYEFK